MHVAYLSQENYQVPETKKELKARMVSVKSHTVATLAGRE